MSWLWCGGGWLFVMVGGCWWWLMVVSYDSGLMLVVVLLLFLLDIKERVRESLTRQGRGERKKNHIESYSNCAYMHGYCNNFAYKQCFRQTDVGSF